MKRISQHIALLLVPAILLALSGCAGQEAPGAASPEGSLDAVYTLSTADRTVEHSNLRELTLQDNEVLTVTQGGAYRITGEQTGQIRIDAQDEIVWLVLENARLRSYSGPVICVRSAAKVVLTVPEGTASTLTDSSFYEDQPSEDACVFSSCHLTINGTGTLEVTGNFGDAVRSKDVLKVLGTHVNIRAKGHGLRGADGVAAEDATVEIQCEGNGIYTTKENKPGRGFAAVTGGSLNIISGEYALSVAENCYLQDCTASIYGVLGDIRCLGVRHIQEGCLQ